MAVKLPNGSLVHIGSAYGSDKTITAATNDSPCVVTSAGHGFSDGDYIVLTSGWTRLDGRVFRITSGTTDTFALEGIDTTDTDVYAAGSGTGTCKKVTTWTQIQQILTVASSGGEQQFTDYQFLEADAAVRIPTFKSAATITLTIGDDPTLPGYTALKSANDDRDPRAVRFSFANSSKLVFNGYLSLASTPSLTVNEIMSLQATATLVNPELSRYST